jgi:hypothetical protein
VKEPVGEEMETNDHIASLRRGVGRTEETSEEQALRQLVAAHKRN